MNLRQPLFVSMLTSLIASAAVSFAEDSPMRDARFTVDGRIVYGVVEDQSVREIDGDLFGAWTSTDRVHALDDVQLLVPTDAGKVIALAGNYRDHLGDRPVPELPEPFFKLPSSLLPHLGNVVQPADHAPVHYEAEVVIVMGKLCEECARVDGDGLCFRHHLRQRHQCPRLAKK